MTVPTSTLADLTHSYRRTQAGIAAATMRQTSEVWRHVNPADVDKTWPAVEAALRQAVQVGYQRASVAGLAYVAAHAQAAGVVPKLTLPGGLPLKQIETVLRVTGPIAVKIAARNGMLPTQAGRVALVRLAGSTSRLALLGGREAITRTVAESPRITGWQRVTAGNCCDFCEMLAGRGAVYQSSDTAGLDASWHDHCSCSAEPLYE